MKFITWNWVLSLLGGVYTAFVAMCMWNWFAVRALDVPIISFAVMLGLVWLIEILIYRPNTDDFKWEALAVSIDACVPDHKREMLNGYLEKQLHNHILTGCTNL